MFERQGANDTTSRSNYANYISQTYNYKQGGILKRVVKAQEGFKLSNVSKEKSDIRWKWEHQFPRDTEVSDYFKSYVYSPGFKRILKNQKNWWENRHPYRKWTHPDEYKWAEILRQTTNNPDLIVAKDTTRDSALSKAFPKLGLAIVGTNPSYVYDQYNVNNYYSNAGHEFNHLASPENIGGAQAEALGTTIIKPVTINEELNSNAVNHDYTLPELQADIWGIKYLLYKEGIYDSRSDKDITEDQIKKLREKYPNERFFYNYDTDKKAAEMLNLIAQSDTKTQQNPESVAFAKSGIKIKPENKGKFTETMKRTGKTAEELSHSSNPLTRKRAIFALNTKHWNHGK